MTKIKKLKSKENWQTERKFVAQIPDKGLISLIPIMNFKKLKTKRSKSNRKIEEKTYWPLLFKSIKVMKSKKTEIPSQTGGDRPCGVLA